MKAITIWQPWASLIVHGAKPYEFRGWRFPRSMLGQRIVIHAGSRRTRKIEIDELLMPLLMRDRFPISAAETCLVPDKAIPVLQQARAGILPIAAGVGTAVLGVPRNGIDVAVEFGVGRANDSDRDAEANWGWPMLEIEIWPEAIPMKGAQGFWTWPTPESVLA